MSVLFVGLLIIISTLTQAGIDPNKWNSVDFISNLLIVLAICIFGIITGNGEGDNHYKTKKDGLFITTYDEYLESDEMARKRQTYTITDVEDELGEDEE